MHPTDQAAYETIGAIRAIVKFKHRSPDERLAMIQEALDKFEQLNAPALVAEERTERR